eukprot:GHUV01021401.1.p2 GENE.GHUV01021401.1~~GHUV01021401.1.p2  ORF type:complete len:120 (-),score=5.19 GHUV01021401.1:101-460(-)
MPFHRGLPETSAYRHIRAIAATHSVTELTWMAHVGRDRAFAGSVCIVSALAACGDNTLSAVRPSTAPATVVCCKCLLAAAGRPAASEALLPVARHTCLLSAVVQFTKGAIDDERVLHAE